MTVASERELIVAAQGGDHAAFALLVDRHLPSLLLRLRRWLDAHAAQDAAQEALLNAWRTIDRLDPDQGFGGWLTVTASRIAWRLRERRDRLAQVDPEALAAAPAPAVAEDEDESQADLRARIAEAVAGLDPERRLWFALRYEQGLPVADIAALLDCSESTMNVRLYRLRRTLAGLLDLDPEDR